MQRQRAQQAEVGPGGAELPGRLAAGGVVGTEDVQGEPHQAGRGPLDVAAQRLEACRRLRIEVQLARIDDGLQQGARKLPSGDGLGQRLHDLVLARGAVIDRSEEHTSELQSLMRNSYAVFSLK